jgi:DNA repair exonuclease SbcCD ATPase subunit
MHIVFDKIKFKNFLSTGNSFTEINLSKNKHTLIVGKNGHGKSLLIEAICFALFNKPYRNINKPQLVNSVNGKNMIVELYFTIGSDKYIIKRGMKPVVFQIIKNGDVINQEADSRDYQEYLEANIIKLRHKSFTQTSIMGTASFVPFMQLSANNRRLFMEDLLDQQIFTTMNILHKAKISDIKDELAELDTDIKIIEEKIALHESFIVKMNDDKKLQIDEILVKIAELENDNEKHESELAKVRDNVSELVKKTLNKEKVASMLHEIHNHTGKLSNSKSRVNEELNFFENNDDCPTCKQAITNDFKLSSIDNNKIKLEKLEENEKLLHKSLKKNNEKMEKINSILLEIDFLLKQESGLQALIKFNNRDLISHNKKIADINSEKNVSFSEGEIHQLHEEFNTKTYKRDELNSRKERMENISLLLKDTGIKAQIVRKYIPIINQTVNKFLEDMNFFINFNLDEQFNETIKSRHRDIFSYESFSEGEKMRLNLALVFTWRAIAKKRSSTTTNLIFFDEIMDSSLDYDGVDTFFKMVDSLGTETNVFIISHKSDMVDKFSNIIKVEKVKNFSKWSV